MLVAFGGLPGSGKTTLARKLAQNLSAVYLRIDTIEDALRSSGVLRYGVGPAGYIAAYKLAEDNLGLGRVVVADSVNALQITRDSWREVARNTKVLLAEVEVRCSDPAEHRRRIEGRLPDAQTVSPLTWEAAKSRLYEPWPSAQIVIETAGRSLVESTDEVIDKIRSLHSLVS